MFQFLVNVIVILFGKINMLVALPPMYVRNAWDYKKANIENIETAISKFNCNNTFENFSIDEKV